MQLTGQTNIIGCSNTWQHDGYDLIMLSSPDGVLGIMKGIIQECWMNWHAQLSPTWHYISRSTSRSTLSCPDGPDFKIYIFGILTSNPTTWLKQNLCFLLSSKNCPTVFSKPTWQYISRSTSRSTSSPTIEVSNVWKSVSAGVRTSDIASPPKSATNQTQTQGPHLPLCPPFLCCVYLSISW